METNNEDATHQSCITVKLMSMVHRSGWVWGVPSLSKNLHLADLDGDFENEVVEVEILKMRELR